LAQYAVSKPWLPDLQDASDKGSLTNSRLEKTDHVPHGFAKCGVDTDQDVKCDETRPFCNQCINSERICTGFEDIHGGLRFRDENVYARGVARRPRGGHRTSPSKSPPNNDTRTNKPSPNSSKTISPRTFAARHFTLQEDALYAGPISLFLDVSLEEQALTYFVRSRMDTSLSQPHTLATYMKQHFLNAIPSGTSSSLTLAIHAVALAVFDQKKSNPDVFAASTAKYAQASSKTSLAISDPEQATSDQLLLTVMQLNSYEVCTMKRSFTVR
jgi:hypothetical protein